MNEKPLSGKKTPFNELIEGALKHYNTISKEACDWSSIIPEAIRFYGKYRDRIEALEAESRISQAQALIDQIQEVIRLTDCPEGYETPCMECEETESCERSKGIDLCLEAKKALLGEASK